MNIQSIALFAATLATAVLSQEQDSKHHNRPCGRCSKDEAEKVVRGLQAQLETRIKNCDYKGCLELCLPGGTYATVDQYCTDGSCCSDVGSLEQWWSFYACTDITYYPVAPVTVQHLNNGTVIIEKPELVETVVANSTLELSAYKEAWHWYPVQSESGCDFRLGYITGNSLNCPAFIPNAISCASPICNANP